MYKRSSMKLNSKRSKTILIVFIHITVWILYLALPYFGPGFPFNEDRFLTRFYSSITFIGYFYLNYFILIPKFFTKKKYLLFTLITLIFLVFLVYFSAFISKPPQEFIRGLNKGFIDERPNFVRFRFIGLFLTFFLGSMALKLFQNWNKREKQLKDAENERIKSELSFLKYQVSPHFLFNTLNSVYSLAVEKSKKTPDVVLKLSELMRYMLYTSSQRFVNLRDEVKHIKSYIELQKLRLFDVVKVDLIIKEKNLDHKIEPMLLIPFVENTFKYGISYSEQCDIIISVKTENNVLIFESKNTVFDKKVDTEQDTGIGLKNVKRRLEILYPNSHELSLTEKNNIYKVKLKIDLNEDELHNS